MSHPAIDNGWFLDPPARSILNDEWRDCLEHARKWYSLENKHMALLWLSKAEKCPRTYTNITEDGEDPQKEIDDKKIADLRKMIEEM